MGVKIKNIDRLLRKLKTIENIDITPAINKATLLVESTAKTLVPVKDGYLRGSIHPEVKKTTKDVVGRVFTNLEYAPYVEFGTGVTGDGTYPYEVEGLEYKDKGWTYQDHKTGEFIHTKGQVAQPYMYPALYNNKDKINKIIDTYVKNELLKLGGNK